MFCVVDFMVIKCYASERDELFRPLTLNNWIACA